MLRFLATNGSQLELNEQTTVDMVDGLIKMCTQHSLYHDIVYARMVVADIGYNKGHDLLLFKVVRVAEALEAAKRYQEAGEIFVRLQMHHSTSSIQMHLQQYSAITQGWHSNVHKITRMLNVNMWLV